MRHPVEFRCHVLGIKEHEGLRFGVTPQKHKADPSLRWMKAVLPMIGRAPLAIAKKPHGVHDWKRVGANVIGALRAEIVISIGLRNAKSDADLLPLWAMQDLLPQRPKRPMIVLDNAIFRHTNRARGR